MRETIERLTISLLVIATALGLASPSSAQVSPHVFELGSYTISIIAPDGSVHFGGTVEHVLNVSDTADDEYTLTVTGRLYLSRSGCAAVRIEYLDLAGNVVDEDRSNNLLKPDKGPAVLGLKVVEADRGPSNLDVRVVLEYGTSCNAKNDVADRQSQLPYAPPNVGQGAIVVLSDEFREEQNYGATLGLFNLMGVHTNPVGELDTGYSFATATISWLVTPSYCMQIEVIAFAEGREEIGRERLEMSCRRDQPVVDTAIFESAELDRLVVRRHLFETDGETEVFSQNVAYYHLFD